MLYGTKTDTDKKGIANTSSTSMGAKVTLSYS